MPYDKFDGQPDPDELGAHMMCFVIGGCANGVTLPNVRIDAERIELKRPDYIKPIASATQKVPEIANESDVYIVHPLGMPNGEGKIAIVGIAVIEGQSLSWAFQQLVVAFAEKSVANLRAAGITLPGTKPEKRTKH